MAICDPAYRLAQLPPLVSPSNLFSIGLIVWVHTSHFNRFILQQQCVKQQCVSVKVVACCDEHFNCPRRWWSPKTELKKA